MADKYSTIQQHQPLRVPETFTRQERAMVIQLDEIFDDIYRRFGRLRIEDMGSAFRKRLEDDEGNISQLIVDVGNIEISVADKYDKVSGITINSNGISISGSKYVQINSGCEMDIESGGYLNVRSSGNLSVKSGGNIDIENGGNVNVKSGGNLKVASGGNIDIRGSGTLSLIGSNVSIRSGSTFDVESENIIINSGAGVFTTKNGNTLVPDDFYFSVGYNPILSSTNYYSYIRPGEYVATTQGFSTYPLTFCVVDSLSDSSYKKEVSMRLGQEYTYFDDGTDYSIRPVVSFFQRKWKKSDGSFSTDEIMMHIGYFRCTHMYAVNAKILNLTYVAISQASSKSIKHNINPLLSIGEKLDQLKPVTFIYDDDEQEKTRMGLIYEDTMEVMPEICTNDESNKAISYVELIPALLKEIQDLRGRVAELEGRT